MARLSLDRAHRDDGGRFAAIAGLVGHAYEDRVAAAVVILALPTCLQQHSEGVLPSELMVIG